MRRTVRAAGGLVWRNVDDLPGRDGVDIVLVHRPRYHDWSIPKGKVDRGETDEECALREVQEETGLTCRLGAELETIEYTDRGGNAKTVRYWAMEVRGGAPSSPDPLPASWGEVDEVAWVPLEHAAGVLTYERDRRVVESFRAWRSVGSPG